MCWQPSAICTPSVAHVGLKFSLVRHAQAAGAWASTWVCAACGMIHRETVAVWYIEDAAVWKHVGYVGLIHEGFSQFACVIIVKGISSWLHKLIRNHQVNNFYSTWYRTKSSAKMVSWIYMLLLLLMPIFSVQTPVFWPIFMAVCRMPMGLIPGPWSVPASSQWVKASMDVQKGWFSGDSWNISIV